MPLNPKPLNPMPLNPMPLNEDTCWDELVAKNADGSTPFIYAVKTTQIYCRPGCSSKLPKRENVEFFSCCNEAETAGYRACKKCRPDEQDQQDKYQQIVTRACQLMENSDYPLSLTQISEQLDLSPWHFHRIFKSILGITPKHYSNKIRLNKFSQKIPTAANITSAIYEAGYNSSSRVYENMNNKLGMNASTYKKGGLNLTIHYVITDCFLGRILVASTNNGICSITLGDSDSDLIAQLKKQFPNAAIAGANDTDELTHQIAQVLEAIQTPNKKLTIPLDIIGTAFQQRVWTMLQQLSSGTTASYAEIAERIGQPTAVRAVARACASNNIAILIPCHRVIGSAGKLTGYRWGIERKRQLLEYEKQILE